MTLVDTNVVIDILSGGLTWASRSKRALADRESRGAIYINEIVYAELSAGFSTTDKLDVEISRMRLNFAPLSKTALFAAGQAFSRYRAAGGPRPNVLADFFLGAQANVQRWPLLTRDKRRYQVYFPDVALIDVA